MSVVVPDLGVGMIFPVIVAVPGLGPLTLLATVVLPRHLLYLGQLGEGSKLTDVFQLL